MIFKYLNKKASISYLQMFILIIAVVSFSYIVYESTTSVDAQSTTIEVCCEETVQGNSCQNAPQQECNTNFKISPSSCEVTEFCEIGCCISPETGLCSARSSKRECEKIGGTFEIGPLCEVNTCEKGCCILGSETKWTTENNCEYEGNSQNKDIPTPWLTDAAHNSELECKFSLQQQDKGACVYDSDQEKKCVYVSLEDCVTRTGSQSNFFGNNFCSNLALNTTCTPKENKGCVEGEEDVFWFDSCGNSEESAQDCSFIADNYCGKVGEEYVCKDIDCPSIGRKNGESWCEYDGIIGDGKDPAGSRHIRHICFRGEERIEPCADFRNEICVEETSQIQNGTFSQAACRVNQWRVCLDINREGGKDKIINKCEANPDCRVKDIDMGGSFAFSVCVPSYPPGFELNQNVLNDDGSLNQQAYYSASPGDNICSTGTKRCTTTWKVGIFCPGCIDNCDCHTDKFTKEMNDLCVSLGDCGGYINYNGIYTDPGYSVKSTGGGTPGKISGSFSNIYDGTPALIGEFQFYETINPQLLRKIQNGNSSSNLSTYSNLSAFEQELLGVSGAYGSSLLLKMLAEGDDNESKWISGITATGLETVSFARYTGGYSNSINSAISSQLVGFQAQESQDFSMIAAMIAGVISYLLTQSILMTMIASLLAFIFFMVCVTVTYDVDFTCSSWQPPEGGADCNKCNDINTPCSEYRCESLGQLCQFINKGTDNELCVARQENKTIPVIQPLLSVITEGYEYKNINDEGFEIVSTEDKECIEAYQTVRFGIKVEPFARCRLGIDPTANYNEMSDLFGPKGNVILPIHRMDLFIPSPDAFRNQYNLTDEAIEELGKIEYFVKCKTASGKVNFDTYSIKSCVIPGPDLTSPIINALTFPINGEFIKFGTKEQDFRIYTNEPSECRWDINDKVYDDMKNQFQCTTDISKYTLYGLPCDTKLTGLQNNTKFFIKCIDQPWWAGTENDSLRNTMEESFEYELQLSSDPLVINNFLPREDSTIIEGFEPISTTLKLTTSGGAQNGKSVCTFKMDNGFPIRFFQTNASLHIQEFSSLMSGDYKLDYLCVDAAGNIAINSTFFKIQIDNFGPKIIRVFNDFGLKIITNEMAECRYNTQRIFIYDNATLMSTADGIEHYGTWELKDYNIQCIDEYENKGPRLKINPY